MMSPNSLMYPIICVIIFVLFLTGILVYLYIKHLQIEVGKANIQIEKLQVVIQEQNDAINNLSEKSQLEMDKIQADQQQVTREFIDKITNLKPLYDEEVPTECSQVMEWAKEKAKDITK